VSLTLTPWLFSGAAEGSGSPNTGEQRMSSTQTEYGDYEGFVQQLRNFPPIGRTELERAAVIALEHLDLVHFAADALGLSRRRI
jgi:hypothetical protein